VLYFVPVVNVDGFKYISEEYGRTGQLKYIRKNRNDGRVDGY
jgi:carboxypeptidase T